MGPPYTQGIVSITEAHLWWERGVVYQIYPRSFQDSGGDGVGDLPGITSRLGYLRWLGVDAVWISPIYPSPMADFGYDVSGYTAIHPMFGTLEDFDALVAEAHRLDLKVILDYVPNHTSNEHPWFVESRSSRQNPKRDWYIWRDPAPDSGPPNNWLSVFGTGVQGDAWEWDALTEQYYYHTYLKEQPDLNWRNLEVREAMLDVLRFWLDRGVDGFRLDALYMLIKDDQLRDNPPNPDYMPDQPPYYTLLPRYSADRPETHEAVSEMRRVVDEYDERLLIGELYLPIERLVTYYGVGGSGVHLPFNFHLILTPWNAPKIATLIDEYEASLPPGGWPNWVLGNHDRPRVSSRVGMAGARVAAMLLLTLRGTPTIYYGDEIGMHDVPIPPERVQDPFEKNVPGIGAGRDPERTPMHWDDGPNAGFCPEGSSPWLPIAGDYPTLNVAIESEDSTSMLTLHRRLLSLRRAEPALATGSYTPIEATSDILAYTRENNDRRFLVVLNLGDQPQTFDPGVPDLRGWVVLNTHLDREDERVAGPLSLRGTEGMVVELSG